MSEGPIFTLSQAERAEQCPGSQALPRIESESEPARRGTVLHEHVRLAKDIGEEQAILLAPADMRAAVEAYDRTGLPDDPEAYASEVAFAIDYETGESRELGRNIERRYAELGVHGGEIAGAADFVALLAGAVDVADLKTGWSKVTTAGANLQVGGLGVCASRVYGLPAAVLRLLVRREDGSGYFERASLDAWDLEDVFMRLQRTARRVRRAKDDVAAGRQPELREGPKCQGCPAFKSCPAKVKLASALAIAPQTTLEEEVRELLTPERARQAYYRLKDIKAVVHAVEEALKAYATETPIDLGDGMEYGPRPSLKPVIDGRKAYALLAERYGHELAGEACDFETTKKAIRESLRPVAPKKGLTKLFDEVIGAMTEKKILTRIAGTKIDAHPVGFTDEEEA